MILLLPIFILGYKKSTSSCVQPPTRVLTGGCKVVIDVIITCATVFVDYGVGDVVVSVIIFNVVGGGGVLVSVAVVVLITLLSLSQVVTACDEVVIVVDVVFVVCL